MKSYRLACRHGVLPFQLRGDFLYFVANEFVQFFLGRNVITGTFDSGKLAISDRSLRNASMDFTEIYLRLSQRLRYRSVKALNGLGCRGRLSP
jgi:hypothetical protein